MNCIEENSFTHICKSDKEIYPSCFAIYARIISENKDSVLIDRFSKWGSGSYRRSYTIEERL